MIAYVDARPPRAPPPARRAAEELDTLAAQLQLAELQERVAQVQDAKIATQLLAEDLQLSDEDDPAASSGILQEQAQLEEQLLLQITQIVTAMSIRADEQAALRMVDAEEASQAASLQLASALEAQEAYDASVVRPHDVALARRIAACPEREWQQRGEWLQAPLDMSDRPREPVMPAAGTRVHRDTVEPSASAVEHVKCAGSSQQRHRHGDPGASSSRAATQQRQQQQQQQRQVQCRICFDRFAPDSMVSAWAPFEVDLSAPSSSRAAEAAAAHKGRCGHLFCVSCMREYAKSAVQARRHDIRCPDPSCDKSLAVDDVLLLLAQDERELQVYEFMIAEQMIDTQLRVYCPYKDCSVLLERPDPELEELDEHGHQAAPYECPGCKRRFCLRCGVAGWHAGLTCQQFQALPPEQRSVADDAAVLCIAHRRAWKRCPAPGCGHVVERIDGCNHVRCVCGADFCYACGALYKSSKPTAGNVHGEPGCACALFTVPAEEAEEAEEAEGDAPAVPRAEAEGALEQGPVVLHRAGRRPKPWRNGRFVSRTRCFHSASIYACPNGPDRCWFWHDEDDDGDARDRF